MYHRNYTTGLQKELDFLKLLVSRFHEQEKVNGLELDVALQKTQDVYEQLLRFKIYPDNSDILPMATDSVTEKKTVEPEKKIVKEVQIPVHEERESEVRTEKPATNLNPKTDTVSKKSGILADKLGTSELHPINETLAQQKTGNDLSSKLQTSPLNSIVSGIGLNDKFLYIRELFKGDNKLYGNTIKRLDSIDTFANALNYIQHHFEWDEKNETFQKFIHLLQRRHGNS